jgi:hypothetical protein
MTVRVVRPRKSIFNMPAFSRQFMSYCVTMTRSSTPDSRVPSPDESRFPLPFVSCVHTGTYSSSGPGAITTPAACTPVCRDRPSSAIA